MASPEDKTPQPRSPAPNHDPVFAWPTPNEEDLLFFVEKNGDLPKNQSFTYGELYKGSNANKYPTHQLVFVSPQTTEKWSQWYYASARLLEDEYNWEINSGEALVRTYLVRRDLYFARTVLGVPGEFLVPVAATPDTRFPQYGFADDTLLEAPSELRSLYVVIKRRFIEPVTVEFQYNDALLMFIKTTREVVPISTATPSFPIPGKTVEIQHANSFHNVRITRDAILPQGASYPYQITSIPTPLNRRFPSRLESVQIIWANAWAASTEAQPSYSEDFFFKFKITDARDGPYEATALRFITPTPAAVQAAYPLYKMPQPVTENVAIVNSWFYASPQGNSTGATAKEYPIPSTIHGEVDVEIPAASTSGGAPDDAATFTPVIVETLAATPGVTTLTGVKTLDHIVRDVGMGLYEVSIIQMDVSNLYS